MDDYDAATYGDTIAGVYDEWFGGLPGLAEQTVAFLAARAGAGPVLELGIGTGRIALPLAERGLTIHGIDSSEAMVARMRARPGGAAIPVTIGNFADCISGGPYSLAFVVFNTFFGLLSQDEQVRCFEGVAGHLAAGGAFVLECFVPDPTRFKQGQVLQTRRVGRHEVHLEAGRHDAVNQRISSQHVVVTEDGIQLYPVQIRYAWPGEIDLMARLAGLQLSERWGGWSGEPFTEASARHISVYRRPNG
jgi:SAM-dependent methyltransferase